MSTSRSGPARGPTSGSADLGVDGSQAAPSADIGELREQIAKTREDLGDTVASLVAKADVKARAQRRAGQVKADLTAHARETIDTARGTVSTLTAKVQQAATSPEGTRKLRRTGVAAAAAGTVAVAAVWVRRRRAARAQTRWHKTLSTGAQAGAQLRDKATEFGSAVLASDLAATAVERARHSAASPRSAARAQGAVVAAVVVLVAGWLRRRASRRKAAQAPG